METYESLFQKENGDLYERIKPLISLVPDFRPLATVIQMRKENDDPIEPQNTWKLLYDEVNALTSPDRRGDWTLVEFLLNGPEDEEEKIVTRGKDHMDFFETYRCLSWLLPHISSCLQNIDRFYISHQKIDLLPMFRPSLHHLHSVRDEETFSIIFDDLSKDVKKLIRKDMVKEALTEKSYGLLKAISSLHNLPMSEMQEINSLEFSIDLFPLLEKSIDWAKVTLAAITSRTNSGVLLSAIQKGYLDTSFWSLEAVVKKAPSIFKILDDVLETYFFTDTDEFIQALRHIMRGSCLTQKNYVLHKVIEKAQFSNEVGMYTLFDAICTYRSYPISEILNKFIIYKKFSLDKNVNGCMDILIHYECTDAIEFLTDEFESLENITMDYFNKINYLVASCENFIIRIIKERKDCDINRIFVAALEEISENILNALKNHPLLKFDEDFVDRIVEFSNASFILSLNYIPSPKLIKIFLSLQKEKRNAQKQRIGIVKRKIFFFLYSMI